MHEEMKAYYEKELAYLMRMGGEFARKYPAIADRLTLGQDNCVDPHVERLLQGVAFMSARVHRRIDDDFPQLSEALLNLLYPSFLRPIPAMTIVECLPDPAQGKKTAGMKIPRGTQLMSRSTVDQLPIRFRTSYDADLWPFRVSEAEWRQPEHLKQQPRATNGRQAVSAARLRLSCLPDVLFAGLPLSKLRVYLAGDSSVVYPLYELMAVNCIEMQIHELSGEKRVIVLGCEKLKAVGFEQDESVLAFNRRSLDGHRLLQEYFTLPEKFLFFDIEGMEDLAATDFGREVDLVLLFSRYEQPERHQVLEQNVNERTFRLGCTPAINLFPQTAEPIQVNQQKVAYTVVPDARQADVMEIYSLDEVEASNPRMRQTIRLEPIYGYRHQTRSENKIAFWSASRQMNELGERSPSQMSLSIVDINGQLTDPEADTLTVRTTCTNFVLPSRLSFGAEAGDFTAAGYAVAKQINCLRRPNASYDPPTGTGQLWRLVSLLSLNYLSLSEEGRGALQEILRVHNFTGATYLENQIGALTALKVSPHFAMVESDYGLSPARGNAVEIELEEQSFAGGSAYLFAAVLDRFLAGYASMNSFTQLTARSNKRKEPICVWPPRSGNQVLL